MAVAEKVAPGMDEAAARRRGADRARAPRGGQGAPPRGPDGLAAGRDCARTPSTPLACCASARDSPRSACSTIALGVGASTALFAVVDAVVLKPLPYPGADSLVRIFDTNLEAGIERTGATTGNLADWRRRARLFDGIAGYYSMGRTLSGRRRARRSCSRPR